MNQWSKLAIITGATSLGTWGFHDLSKNVKSLNSGENRARLRFLVVVNHILKNNQKI